MTVASVAIAVLALLFAVASFWWLNARRGRVVGAVPHAYGMAAAAQVFLLRLPLALYNTGARAIVVRDLRCWFPEAPRYYRSRGEPLVARFVPARATWRISRLPSRFEDVRPYR
jgi:hypothetical protein